MEPGSSRRPRDPVLTLLVLVAMAYGFATILGGTYRFFQPWFMGACEHPRRAAAADAWVAWFGYGCGVLAFLEGSLWQFLAVGWAASRPAAWRWGRWGALAVLALTAALAVVSRTIIDPRVAAAPLEGDPPAAVWIALTWGLSGHLGYPPHYAAWDAIMPLVVLLALLHPPPPAGQG
ncbi:MAG: hypothetical protein HY722_16635 [Planctomycetes bacterium]|nr:hypothetical protein [Planctomycetota bacterium]